MYALIDADILNNEFRDAKLSNGRSNKSREHINFSCFVVASADKTLENAKTIIRNLFNTHQMHEIAFERMLQNYNHSQRKKWSAII